VHTSLPHCGFSFADFEDQPHRGARVTKGVSLAPVYDVSLPLGRQAPLSNTLGLVAKPKNYRATTPPHGKKVGGNSCSDGTTCTQQTGWTACLPAFLVPPPPDWPDPQQLPDCQHYRPSWPNRSCSDIQSLHKFAIECH